MPKLIFEIPSSVTVDKEATERFTGGKWREPYHIDVWALVGLSLKWGLG